MQASLLLSSVLLSMIEIGIDMKASLLLLIPSVA